MENYVIFTDSACDMEERHFAQWGVTCLDLSLLFDGDSQSLYNSQIHPKDFYERMRAGGVAKTSAINVATFKEQFRLVLEQGQDILYLGFSSGLSTTVNSGAMAAAELKEEYPHRKIRVVDSLSASAGLGLLLYLTVKRKKEGASLEEAAAYAERLRPQLCHWFTVDDLVYLKRGGRISPTLAFVGGVLGIKPVLHMDDEGHLVSVSKARGRKNALRAIANKYGELAQDPSAGPIFICHGDCPEDVELLSSMLRSDYGVGVDITVYTGPVIGAHSGPGTLALFFLGKER